MSAPHDDHTSGAKDPNVRESGQKVWTIFHSAFIVFILVVGVLAIKDTWARWKEAAEEEKAEAAAYIAAHPPTPQPAPIVKIGRQATTHSFGSNGCVVVWLEGDWISYPQPLDAKLQFFDQHGRLVLEQGAKKKGASLYPGSYRICRAPGSHGTGVQIWN